MPFSHRVFCRDATSPSLSEVVVWLRQRGFPAQVAGRPTPEDLLSAFWREAAIAIDDSGATLGVTCARADAAGIDRLREEVADFTADVGELPPSPARSHVLEHLSATRQVLIAEFPAEGHPTRLEGCAEALEALFTERAGGLTQCDGVGFVDEDGDLVLGIG